MRLKRTAAVVGATLAIGGLGGIAYAANANGTVSPTTVPPAGGTVTLTYSATPNTLAFIQLCRADFGSVAKGTPEIDFNPDLDCNLSVNPTTPASGSNTYQYLAEGGTFSGVGAYGCGPLNAGDGSERFNTCYIRIAPGTLENKSEDVFIPLSFTGSGTQVPEVPLNILLPASAAAVLGGGLLVARKRQQRAA